MKNIYVCGPTVYSSPHVGNMRPIIIFDIFRRSLEFLGKEINFIHNITDVDDKIIQKAIDENTTESEIAKKYEKEYKSLLEQANIIKPNLMPRVIENMEEIIEYIKKLIKNGNAYEYNGNVFFSVESIESYGSVSNRKLDMMRYEDSEGKKHPADFALWKSTERGIKFVSPWGEGRPGWHTECSVFIGKYLKGESLDIHGGGIDLLFPHHENENVQHFAIYSKPITKEWRHVGHVKFDGEKMSKSLGNILSAQDYFNEFSADTLRYIFLTSSYSAPVDLTKDLSLQAFKQVEKFRKKYLKSLAISTKEFPEMALNIAKDISEWRFSDAMKSVNKIIKDFNIEQNPKNANMVVYSMKMLGFGFTKINLTEEDKEKIMKWEQLKKDKSYEKADVLRSELLAKKVI